MRIEPTYFGVNFSGFEVWNGWTFVAWFRDLAAARAAHPSAVIDRGCFR